MIKPRLFSLVLITTWLLAACNLPAAEPTATPTPAVSPTPEASPTTVTIAQPTEPLDLTAGKGLVSGIVCYPSEFIPPMTLYFLEVNSQALSSFDHDDGVQPYSVELDPGTYVAYAYRKGTTLAGSYSAAVPCGLTVACTDHTLLEIQVTAGGQVNDIDICDWVAEPGTVPTEVGGMGLQAQPTATAVPPQGGISLNCDGTYQRVRIVDQGAAGKTVAVDNWNGGAWVNVWNLASGDPMLKQLTDDAGHYPFGACGRMVIVPFRHSNPQLWMELGVYRWNGATMTEVYFNEGYYGEWSKTADVVTFKEATTLGNVFDGPLGPCSWLTLEHEWDGAAFQQVGSVVEPVPNCTQTVP